MEIFEVDGMKFEAGSLDMFGVKILLIRGGRGALGCGYLSLDAAEKFGHALAIVKGVAAYGDMLSAEVAAVSSAAAALGVSVGMSGLEVLKKLV